MITCLIFFVANMRNFVANYFIGGDQLADVKIISHQQQVIMIIRKEKSSPTTAKAIFRKKFNLGHVQGAGSFTTINNQKFIFNEQGIFNFLHIPQTSKNPEVRIQIRMERYPNRRINFGM